MSPKLFEEKEVGWVETPAFLTIVYKGKTATIRKTNKKDTNKYKKAKKAIESKDKASLVSMLFPKERIEKYTESRFIVDERSSTITDTKTNKKLHPVFVKKLDEFEKDSLPYKAFVKFWENLLKNPDQRSIDQLYNYLEHYHFPITSDGCFLAYKYVRELDNGKLVDSHSGRFDNSVGAIPVMNRKKCCSDPTVECASGLHVAAYKYASNCGSGNIIIEVKVNPKDVVSVPKDNRFQKLRCCRYEVIRRNIQECKKSYLKQGYWKIKKEEKKIVCFDEIKLSGMTAAEIVNEVHRQTGIKITTSLKNKKTILKKAINIFNQHGLGTEIITINLKNKTAKQIIDIIKETVGVTIQLSLKNKKSILCFFQN